MAYKVLPTDWTWKGIFDELESLLYRRLTIEEIVEEMKLKTDISKDIQKRGRGGFKIQYVYTKVYRNQTVRARIFLNISGATGRVDEKKWAYARLEHLSSGTYLSSPDILFTKGFPEKIKACAKAFKDVVDHWPIGYGEPMKFAIIPGVMNVRTFISKKNTTLYFLRIPISLESKRFFKDMFEPALKRMKKAKAKGETIVPVRKKRADKRVTLTSTIPDQTNSAHN